MPKISVRVEHHLGADEAASRMQRAIAVLEQEHGNQLDRFERRLEGRHGTFELAASGMKARCELDVDDDAVTVVCQVPLVAAMFKDRIEREIRQHLGEVLR
jgi:hypothetical protein